MKFYLSLHNTARIINNNVITSYPTRTLGIILSVLGISFYCIRGVKYYSLGNTYVKYILYSSSRYITYCDGELFRRLL